MKSGKWLSDSSFLRKRLSKNYIHNLWKIDPLSIHIWHHVQNPNNLVLAIRPTSSNYYRFKTNSVTKRGSYVYSKKDTCWTARWISLSGLWLSFKSCRICCKPCSSGCHAILVSSWSGCVDPREVTRPAWFLRTFRLKLSYGTYPQWINTLTYIIYPIYYIM